MRGELQDFPQTGSADGNEPEDHDGTEDLADASRASLLQEKQCDQHRAGQRHDERFGRLSGNLQPLDSREH